MKTGVQIELNSLKILNSGFCRNDEKRGISTFYECIKGGILNIRYYIDPETQLPHIYGHDVEETEVEEVLSNPGEDRPGREESRIAIGKTLNGRYLRIIYVPDPAPNSVFVITAYELAGKPLVAYRRRRRKKK